MGASWLWSLEGWLVSGERALCARGGAFRGHGGRRHATHGGGALESGSRGAAVQAVLGPFSWSETPLSAPFSRIFGLRCLRLALFYPISTEFHEFRAWTGGFLPAFGFRSPVDRPLTGSLAGATL